MARLLIIYDSRTGGARQMAAAAAEGGRGDGACDIVMKFAPDAGPDDLLSADGYVFAAPENLAAISGRMKDFFDRSYYPALGRIEGRPCALMVCAGSDGENAVRQMARIATGWRLRQAQAPILVCTHAQTPEQILAPKTICETDLARCRELGAAMAAGLALGVF
ncbi:MAG: NAD(P)H-dependent oxidoreductase [Parvularculaceae bacterium]